MPNLFDKFTDKRGLFIFNGESSADFDLVVSEVPTFEKAGRKSSAFDIPGEMVLFCTNRTHGTT